MSLLNAATAIADQELQDAGAAAFNKVEKSVVTGYNICKSLFAD